MTLRLLPPFSVGMADPRDHAHLRLISYVQRRLERLGWLVLREVEIVTGPARGFIDLLAYREQEAAMLIVEVKRSLDDIGSLERSLAWYERGAAMISREHGWIVRAHATLVTAERSPLVLGVLERQGRSMSPAFPTSARRIAVWIADPSTAVPAGRALALIDSGNKRRSWLLPASLG